MFEKLSWDAKKSDAVRTERLGWSVLREGEYKIALPPLSADEETVVLATEKEYRKLVEEKELAIEEIESELGSAILRHAEADGIALDREQREYLAKYAKMHLYGFAFLDELLANDEIEEISVIAVGKPAYVFIRKGGWQSVNARFDDEKTLMEVVNKMAAKIGRRITLQHPRLDAMLPDGSRLHASLPPVSGGELTVRKFRERPFSPREIADGGTATHVEMALLSTLMQTDCSIMVVGNTASGKTTTLNALFCFVPASERVVIVEETPEINIPHEHQVRLAVNREMGIGLGDLVYDSLRMRPDRMIVGEVRAREEVEALFDVLLAGQARGTYATFHGQSAHETLLRLANMGVDRMDLPSMDAMVVQRRGVVYSKKSKKGRELRKVTEICEIGANGEPRPLVRNGKVEFGADACGRTAESLGLSAREYRNEVAERAGWLARAPGSFQPFFEAAQKRIYGM
ncbi:MAG: ATPase, T2SS/T4P/T4SS family [Candidatus ainarchaeum sp.]|nr:ATPase, T2SS/T4P/T4SS family [Candidatus ainarchaeum sp.]